ncbi:unnamed protein product [Camellia sinensis]
MTIEEINIPATRKDGNQNRRRTRPGQLAEREYIERATSTRLQDQEKTSADRKDGHEWMVYFSTFVASCGAYSLGTCVGYSSPVQSAITEDLNLSIAEYSLFGSIMTFGAMAGAITCGPIADFIGRKGVSQLDQPLDCLGQDRILPCPKTPLPLDKSLWHDHAVERDLWTGKQ